jgi:large subunit ribosomal protein L30
VIPVSEIKISYVKSACDGTKKQIANIKALGLKKLNSTVIKNDTPQIRGMISRVNHLVIVEEIKEV